MTEGETHTICPTCEKRIEPTEPGAVYAVKLVRIEAFGPSTEYVEGNGSVLS
jgi:hypothetical protein